MEGGGMVEEDLKGVSMIANCPRQFVLHLNKYATAQAKLSEDEALRVRYKSGTPLEGGKIAESEPVDLFSSARNISSTHTTNTTHPSTTDDQQPQRSSHDSLSLEEILMLQVKVIRV
uniref:Uncharacterized protein n=1 Tax=Vitis vinifera TaxID=29760 RepID=A5C478_VITVI|nr:hypothetical protein VITISV_007158 [Vitis vinifera]